MSATGQLRSFEAALLSAGGTECESLGRKSQAVKRHRSAIQEECAGSTLKHRV